MNRKREANITAYIQSIDLSYLRWDLSTGVDMDTIYCTFHDGTKIDDAAQPWATIDIADNSVIQFNPADIKIDE